MFTIKRATNYNAMLEACKSKLCDISTHAIYIIMKYEQLHHKERTNYCSFRFVIKRKIPSSSSCNTNSIFIGFPYKLGIIT